MVCTQTIDWIMKVEDGFFPKLAGELGSSLSDIKQQQKRLEDFKPTAVVSFHSFFLLFYLLNHITVATNVFICRSQIFLNSELSAGLPLSTFNVFMILLVFVCLSVYLSVLQITEKGV